MLVMFDFSIVQLRYVRAAMVQIPSFRQDGLGPDEVMSMISSALFVRAAYVTAKNAIDGARATRRTGTAALHDGCVSFAAQGRSTFRKNATLVQRFDRLPVQDQTFQETMTRADAIAAFWATLPLVGSPPAAFKYGQGAADVTLAQFGALQTTTRGADAAIPELDQAFQKQEGLLHETHAELDDFVSAAVATGRSRYIDGTADREVIEAIPGSLPAHPPQKAVITALTANPDASFRVQFTAPGATSFDVFFRIQPAAAWTLTGDDIIERELDIPRSIPGAATYEVKVVPRNSRGTGPESDVATLTFAS
jgi:hypothetical protein